MRRTWTVGETGVVLDVATVGVMVAVGSVATTVEVTLVVGVMGALDMTMPHALVSVVAVVDVIAVVASGVVAIVAVAVACAGGCADAVSGKRIAPSSRTSVMPSTAAATAKIFKLWLF